MDDDIVTREQIAALLRLARLLTSDRGAAEDLVQECLVRVVKHRRRFEAARHPSAYLRRMLMNVHIDHSRSRSQLGTVPLGERGDVPDREGVDLSEREALWSEVARLPVRQRACIVLRYYEDLDVSEIADILGILPSSARSNLARALDALRTTRSETTDGGRQSCAAPNNL